MLPDTASPDAGEAGYMLIGVVVMVAIVLLALSVAAPVVARDLQRDKEIESQHRMEQYVRAIQLYQRKFPGQYPASIKVLENSNNIRFLRKQWIDPLTGQNFRLIHQGEQQTKIHVFFGQELGGLTASLGAAAGLASGTPGTAASTSTIGATSALASGFGGASITTAGTSGSTGATGASGASGSSGDTTGGIIVGVGTTKTGASITDPNGQDQYSKWEFWYDPRIELLRKQVNITGGGVSSTDASSFGQGINGQPNGATGSTGASGASGSTGATGPATSPFGTTPF
jgi:type II secretory pathway pseudopilin PulG